MRFSRPMAEMRELAVARAADLVRDVAMVVHRGLDISSGGFDMGGSGAAFVAVANAAYARALNEVMMEHAVLVDDEVQVARAGSRASGGAGVVTEPHPFLPSPRRPEEPATCALCGQDEAALVHHPELFAAVEQAKKVGTS